MTNTFLPPHTYFKSLPKKRMAAGVLLFNRKGELLIVKPNYRKGWSIPGGNVHIHESPKAAAIRETLEETGLHLQESQLKLVCVDYTSKKGIETESLQFIFYGGLLHAKEISSIQIAEEELESFRFVPAKMASARMDIGLKKRLPLCLQAIKNAATLYLES